MSEEITFETVLLVSSEEITGMDRPALRITLRAAKLQSDGHIRNFSDHAWPREPMADFAINAQCDIGSQPYGWRAEFAQPYSVDLQRADEMVKVLRGLVRGMDKLHAELGHADTFGAYVARAAKVLKVKRFGWCVERDARGWSYDDSNYRFSDIEGAQYRLSSILSDFEREHEHV